MSLTAREPTTEWVEVDAATDFSHQFVLPSLQPDTKYAYAVETVGDDGAVHGEFRGTFKTAPRADAASNLKFCVMTCQGYADRDGADGHPIYPAMQKLAPHFIAMTGDLVYYDSDEPRAVSEDLARLHWERMFSLPRQVELLRNMGSYWLKDDHDTLRNDSWPGGGRVRAACRSLRAGSCHAGRDAGRRCGCRGSRAR